MTNRKTPFGRFDALPEAHLFRSWPPDAPPWEMARHYFVDPLLKGVRNQWSKFVSLVETPRTSDGAVAEAAWLAELEAFWILTRHLGFVAEGFEVRSPLRADQGQTCDLGGCWDGKHHFVEVKCRAREDRELVPDKVHEVLAISREVVGFEVIPTVLSASAPFDDGMCERLRAGILGHVERWASVRGRTGLHFPSVPPSYTFGGVLRVMFHERPVGPYQPGQFFTPLDEEEIGRWLFGNAVSGRTGKLDEAVSKGATVLAIRVSSFPQLEEIIGSCFPAATPAGERTYRTSDHRLGEIRRVLVVRSWDDYALVVAE